MTFKEIQELITLINKSNNLTEFRMKDGEFEITIRTGKYSKGKEIVHSNQMQMPVATSPAPPIAAPLPTPATPAASSKEVVTESPAPAASGGGYLEIKSPIVGTFYRSSGPDKPAFAKVGDTISPGSVVCIVEAMKLFNEIESEISGKVVKVMVDDASPVEYDQVLFLVDPKG